MRRCYFCHIVQVIVRNHHQVEDVHGAPKYLKVIFVNISSSLAATSKNLHSRHGSKGSCCKSFQMLMKEKRSLHCKIPSFTMKYKKISSIRLFKIINFIIHVRWHGYIKIIKKIKTKSKNNC